jgi:CDP-paratose 2-epimerase
MEKSSQSSGVLMRVLITGGAGFVGSQLAFRFKELSPKHEVTVLDNLKRRGSELNLAPLKKKGIEFVHGDIRIPSDLNDLPGDFDLLVECSAEPSVLAGTTGSPDYVLHTNLTGTIHCLEFARKRCGGVIFLSTSRVYSIAPLRELNLTETATRFELADEQRFTGVTAEGISESFPTNLARSFYGATKLASENIIQEYCHSYGLKAVINRCGVIAGAGQFGKVDQGVVTLWAANHIFKKPLSYMGFGASGKQVRDILHPSDLFSLLCKQAENLSAKCDVFNVGGGRNSSVSLKELTELCQEVSGAQVSIANHPATNSVDIPLYLSDSRKVKSAYDWKPTYSPREIVTDICGWLKENYESLKPIFGVAS